MTTWEEVPGKDCDPFVGHINLFSLNNRAEYRRGLDESFGKGNWTNLLNHACTVARQLWNEKDWSIDLASVDSTLETSYLIRPYVADYPLATVLFGPGDIGKSYLALAMAAAIAKGDNFLDTPCEKGSVIIIDYETSERDVKRRLLRLGLSDFGNIIYWPGRGRPLADSVIPLQRIIRERNVKLVIVDSAVTACGDDPKEEAVAARYFNGLRQLGVANLTISHMTKDEKDDVHPFGCHDNQTEVLTDTGWLAHGEVTGAETVLCFDPETEAFEWAQPTAVHRYEYDGPMMRFSAPSFDICVTPSHRMVVKGAWPGVKRSWEFREAQTLTGSPFTMPAAGTPPGGALVLPNEFVRFLGWWLSEGSLNDDAPTLTQAVGPLADEMMMVLDRLGYEYNDWVGRGRDTEQYVHQIRLRGQTQLGRWLRRECGSHAPNKRIPEMCWLLGPEQKRLLMESLMDGDGHWYRPTRGAYTTTSQRLADDVMRLAILCGYGANIRSEPGRRAHHHARLRVNIVRGRNVISLRRQRHTTHGSYSGSVYCLTVPTGAYVTRRNGKAAITGNSIFWYNLGRLIWNVKASDDDDQERRLGVFNRKNNEDKKHPPFGVTIRFEEGATIIAQENLATDLHQYLKLPARIRSSLRGGAVSTRAIASELDAKEDSVSKALRRMSDVVRVDRGGEVLWGLRAQD